MGVKLAAASGGSIELVPTNTASNFTVTVPAVTGTAIVGLNGIASEAQGGTGTTTGYYGFKNRLINSAMVISQRNAGASVTPTTDGQYGGPDRWNYWLSQTSKFSVQQSTVAPTGFSNSLLVTSLSAYSVTSNDYFAINQKIEGFNFSDMMWGTASAATVTLSFWVRSSLTGTFGGAMTNNAFNRSYPFSYTISVADTWEQKSVTITGDTTGTWVGATNGVGVIAQFNLGSVASKLGTANTWSGAWYTGATGATSVVGTNGATFYITGVQLEKGSTATSFDYRPYGTELGLCQRYCRTIDANSGNDKAQFSGVAYLNNTIIASYTFPTMRTAPIATITNPTALDVVTSTVTSTNNTIAFSELTSNSSQVSVANSGTPFTAGHGAVIRSDGYFVVFSAEL